MCESKTDESLLHTAKVCVASQADTHIRTNTHIYTAHTASEACIKNLAYMITAHAL